MSRTALTTVKIAVLVPMPSVSAATAAIVKPGLRRNMRSECCKSFRNASMHALDCYACELVRCVPGSFRVSDQRYQPMPDDQFLVTCPYCGERVELYLESDVEGSFVQDCEVCCNPWTVRVSGDGDERDVSIERADGSE